VIQPAAGFNRAPEILPTVWTSMQNISIAPERPETADASALIAELDAFLEPLYPPASLHGLGPEQLIRDRTDFFVLRCEGQPAGCGGIQFAGDGYSEITRVFVRPAFRRMGLGKALLRHLEEHSRARGMLSVRLETGARQPDAITLYERAGYRRIAPFGPNADDPLSVFYEKRLE
jgi:putative acetyltransferase